MKFFDLIQSKIELFRLEQRYTRRRNRRSTFVSDATYVNGEYVYNYDVSAKASQHTGGSSSSESSTVTNSTTNNSLGRREARIQRKRGNSLIMEVNAELERAEREQAMEVEDLVGRIASPVSPVIEESLVEPVSLGSERRKKNRLSRISIREMKWDTDKGQ